MAGNNNQAAAGDATAGQQTQTQNKNTVDTPIFVNPNLDTAKPAGDRPVETGGQSSDLNKFQQDSPEFKPPATVSEGNAVARAVASESQVNGRIRPSEITTADGSRITATVQTRGTEQVAYTNTGERLVRTADSPVFVPVRATNTPETASLGSTNRTANAPVDSNAARTVDTPIVRTGTSSVEIGSSARLAADAQPLVRPPVDATTAGKAPVSSVEVGTQPRPGVVTEAQNLAGVQRNVVASDTGAARSTAEASTTVRPGNLTDNSAIVRPTEAATVRTGLARPDSSSPDIAAPPSASSILNRSLQTSVPPVVGDRTAPVTVDNRTVRTTASNEGQTIVSGQRTADTPIVRSSTSSVEIGGVPRSNLTVDQAGTVRPPAGRTDASVVGGTDSAPPSASAIMNRLAQNADSKTSGQTLPADRQTAFVAPDSRVVQPVNPVRAVETPVRTVEGGVPKPGADNTTVRPVESRTTTTGADAGVLRPVESRTATTTTGTEAGVVRPVEPRTTTTGTDAGVVRPVENRAINANASTDGNATAASLANRFTPAQIAEVRQTLAAANLSEVAAHESRRGQQVAKDTGTQPVETTRVAPAVANLVAQGERTSPVTERGGMSGKDNPAGRDNPAAGKDGQPTVAIGTGLQPQSQFVSKQDGQGNRDGVGKDNSGKEQGRDGVPRDGGKADASVMLTAQQLAQNAKAMELAGRGGDNRGENRGEFRGEFRGENRGQQPKEGLPTKPGEGTAPKPGEVLPGAKPGDLTQLMGQKPGEQQQLRGPQIDEHTAGRLRDLAQALKQAEKPGGDGIKGGPLEGSLVLGKDGKPVPGGMDGKVESRGDLNAALLAAQKMGLMITADGKPMLPGDTRAGDSKAMPILDVKTLTSLDPKAIEALVKSQPEPAKSSLESGKSVSPELGTKAGTAPTEVRLDATRGASAAAMGFELSSQQGKSLTGDKVASGNADAQSRLEGKPEPARLEPVRNEAVAKNDAAAKSDAAAFRNEPTSKPTADKPVEAVKGETTIKPETTNKVETGRGELTSKPEVTPQKFDDIAASARGDRSQEANAKHHVSLAQPETSDDAWVTKKDSDTSKSNLADSDENRSWENKDRASRKEKDAEEDKLEEEQRANARAQMIAAMMAQKKQQEQAEKDRQLLIDEAKKKGEDKRRRYVVKEKDTLESIAKKQLRDVRLSALIYEINKHMLPVRMEKGKQVVDPRPGTSIWLPSESEIREFRSRLYAPTRPPVPGQPANRTAADKAGQSPEDELAARFGSGWDGQSGAASPAAGMLGAAVAKSQVRRANIEKILGPMAPKTPDSGRIRYIVRLSDTLEGVAAKHPALKDASLWPLLARLNELSDEADDDDKPLATLRRGMVLNLPTPQEISQFRQTQEESGVADAGQPSASSEREDAADESAVPAAMKESVSQVLSSSLSATQLQQAALAAAAALRAQMEAEEAEQDNDDDDEDFDDDDEEFSSPVVSEPPPPVVSQPRAFLKDSTETRRLEPVSGAAPSDPLLASVFDAAGGVAAAHAEQQNIQNELATVPLPVVSQPMPSLLQDSQLTRQPSSNSTISADSVGAVSNPASEAVTGDSEPVTSSSFEQDRNVPASPNMVQYSGANPAFVNSNPGVAASPPVVNREALPPQFVDQSLPPAQQQPTISAVPARPPMPAPDPQSLQAQTQAAGVPSAALPSAADILQAPPMVSGDRLLWEIRPGIRLVKSCLRWDPAIGVFRAQLEMLINGVWYPVIFYEVFPQGSVRHEYSPGGKRKSVRIDLPPATVQELADNDLASKWLAYCRQYLTLISAAGGGAASG